MSNQNDKAQMLRAMLAGKPTKESQALAMKTSLYQDKNNVHTVNPHQLEESIKYNALPSASDVVLTHAEASMVSHGAVALPPVSENDIANMLSGKKMQPRQQIQESRPQAAPMLDYFAPTDGERPMVDMDVNEVIRQKYAQKQGLNENRQVGNNITLNPDTIIDIVENIVYGVLGQLVEEANENKLNKETIRMKIGESIFSGKLEKSLTKPVKPENKK